MKPILFVFCLILFWLGACTTANKNGSIQNLKNAPPDIAYWPINNQLQEDKDFESIDLFLQKALQETPSKQVAWWSNYRRAQLWEKKDAKISCDKYAELAANPEFPLHRLAYLRAHEICPNKHHILSRLAAFDLNYFNDWLFEDAINVAIIKAKNLNEYEDLIELHLKKSKMNIRKEEKVENTLRAIEYAQKVNNIKKLYQLRLRLYELSPSYTPQPPFQDWLSVANDFRYRRQFAQARQMYNKVIHYPKSKVNDIINAYKGIRLSYKLEQNKQLSVNAARDMARYAEAYLNRSKKRLVDYNIYSDAQLVYIRALWTEDHFLEAEKEIRRAENKLNGKFSLSEYYWIKARIFEEKMDYTKAIEYFQQAIAASDKKNINNKYYWYLAWNQKKAGVFDDAQNTFETLLENTTSAGEKNQYQYWLAKTLKTNNNSNNNLKAEALFKEIINDDPLSYYGLLSFRELDKELPLHLIKGAEEIISTYTPMSVSLSRPLQSLLDQNYLEWLIAVKENTVAKDYLNLIGKKISKTESNNDEVVWHALFKYFAKSNNYQAMFNQLALLPPAVRRSIIETYPHLIFPKPYFETVTQSAHRFGISPEFIYSIMRQESSFNPEARSPMDAFGLMQLLPEVAKKSAQENNILLAQAEDLYTPHINIPIGSAYLRELWDKYNGELIPAVASYNASEKAIMNWLKNRYHGDSLSFIEDIPYEETRLYVKLVLRNLIVYQMIISNENKYYFPDWVLRIGR